MAQSSNQSTPLTEMKEPSHHFSARLRTLSEDLTLDLSNTDVKYDSKTHQNTLVKDEREQLNKDTNLHKKGTIDQGLYKHINPET